MSDSVAAAGFLIGVSLSLLIGIVIGAKVGMSVERDYWLEAKRRIVDGKVEFWHGPEWRKQP